MVTGVQTCALRSLTRDIYDDAPNTLDVWMSHGALGGQAGQLAELLAVGLDEVGGGGGHGGGEGGQGRVGGVHGDAQPGGGPAQADHEPGVPVDGGARRQGAGQDRPVVGRGGAVGSGAGLGRVGVLLGVDDAPGAGCAGCTGCAGGGLNGGRVSALGAVSPVPPADRLDESPFDGGDLVAVQAGPGLVELKLVYGLPVPNADRG